MDKTGLDRHLQYTAWATSRLLKAANTIAPDQLLHDFKTSDRSIVGTLAHVFAADRIWLDRVTGRQRAAFIEDRDRDLKVLCDEWPKLHIAWREWLASYSRHLNSDAIAYTNLKGDPFTSTATEIILHVVNHGTHHRGQVSGFLRMLGHTPPPLDLIAFYRSE
ncbi:MAG TPA: DinB family protein [Verrucomicrobiae bacterium]|nr:DinB family protein [Verrucomicrobiae bacterium]